MIGTSVAPFLIFFIGAVVAALVRGWARKAVLLAIPVAGAANLAGLADGTVMTLPLLGHTLEIVQTDRLSLLFGGLFHLAAFACFLFSVHVEDTAEHVAGVLYAGSAIGAVFAGDLLTLFIFWELAALASVVLIFAQRTERSYGAAMRYLVVQVLSGLILLEGILIRVSQGGVPDLGPLGLHEPGGSLILLAIGIQCGFPLLHTWLTESYSEATPTGTVFLSALTTTLGVYLLAKIFAGTELLIYVGAAMAVFAIIYAIIENDLRRVLAYVLISQLGFMVAGVGVGSELALNGIAGHAVTHVVSVGLLFMATGAVLFRAGTIKGSELGGLYRSMPWTAGFSVVGGLSVSAFPLLAGFVSQSMIMTAVLRSGHDWVWSGLLFAIAGALFTAGIKVPFSIFFAKVSNIPTQEAPRNMLLAMGIWSVVCILVGVYPQVLYEYLPYSVDFEPYTAERVVAQGQLLSFAALGFVMLKLTRVYPAETSSVTLDVEWLYRRLAPHLIVRARGVLLIIDRVVRKAAHLTIRRAIQIVEDYHGENGLFARTWSSGAMTLVALVLLGATLATLYL